MAEVGQFPSQAAAERVRQLVRRVAVEAFDAEIVETPIPGFTAITDRQLDDPLVGVRAAMLIRRVADGQLHEQARAARAVGRTWDDIGAALDLPTGDDHDARSSGEVAFGWLVEGREPDPDTDALPSFQTPSTWWRCGACDGLVTDRGPFESHPDDNETGHAPTCTRHQAAVAEWAARTEPDDDGDLDDDRDLDDDGNASQDGGGDR